MRQPLRTSPVLRAERVLFCCFCGFFIFCSAGAATFTWTGAVSSDWFNTNNWSPSGLPGSNDTVNVNSGAITFSAPVALGGQFNWSGGSLSGNALTIATNGTLNISGFGTKYLWNALTNAGAVIWSNGNLEVDYSSANNQYGLIVNSASALWDIQTSQNLLNGYNNGAFFQNAGTVRRSVAGGTATISIPFNNAGTVSVLQGILTLSKGGIIEGSYSAASGATLNFSSGNFSYNTAPTMTGPGTFQFTGGSLVLSNDAIANLQLAGGTVTLGLGFQGGTITNLTLSGATLNNSNLVVSGMFNWSGTVTGAVTLQAGATVNWSGGYAQGPVTIASNATLNLSGNNNKYLWNALTNAGTVTWTGFGNLEVDFNSVNGESGLIINSPGGLWDIQNNQYLSSGYANGAYFQNAGTVRKSAGSSTTVISIPFYNSGAVTVQQGTLVLNGGGTIEGSFSAAAGAGVTFGGGAFAYNNAPTLSGSGAIQMTGGTLTLLNNTVPNLQLAGGTVTLGPGFQGGTITNLTVLGGTLSGNSLVVSGTFNWAGTLPGSLTLLAGATVTWSGGYAQGPVTITSNAVLNITGTPIKYLWNSLTNAGTVNWTGGNLEVDYSTANNQYGLIQNLAGSLWNIQCDQYLNSSYSGTYFQNAGTVRKSLTSGATVISVPFYNSGSIIVQQGTLSLNSGGIIGGSWNAAAGTFINLASGAFSYTTPPVLSGAGTIQLTGGSLGLLTDIIPNLQLAGGLVSLGPNFQGGSITNLTLLAGVLSGGSFTVSGVFNWAGTVTGSVMIASGGTVNWSGGYAQGPVTVASNAVLNINGSVVKYLWNALNNFGTVTWSGPGNLEVDYSSSANEYGLIQNQPGALFDIQNNQALNTGYNVAYFQNAGTVRKSAGNSTSTIAIPFYNSGLVLVQQGTLVFNRGGTIEGTFSAATGTTISFNQGNFAYSAVPTLIGSGLIQLTGGSLTLSNNAIPNLQLAGGTVTLGPNFQGGAITNLTLLGGSMTGTTFVVSGTFNLSGALAGSLTILSGGTVNWSGGSVQGPVNVAGGGRLNLSGSPTKALYNALTNAGTVTWTGTGNFEVDYNTVNTEYGLVVNLPGALFDIQNDQNLLNLYNNGAFFQNAGTLRKSAGTGITTISIPFYNSGNVSVLAQTLTFNGGAFLGGTFSAAAGATINFNTGAFTYTTLPTMLGQGRVQLTGGSLTLWDNIIPNLQLAGGTITLGPNFQGGTITNLTLLGGTLTGNSIVSGLFNWSGTLPGSLTLLGGATVNWSGGYAQGPVNVANNATLNIIGDNSKFLWNALTNAGTVTWSGNGVLEVDYSTANNQYGLIQNLVGGLWDIQNNQVLNDNYTNAYFANAGTLRKSAGNLITTIWLPIFNSGIVMAVQGTLAFNGATSLGPGTLVCGLGDPINYGRFSFPSAANLAGTLNVTWLSGFVPAISNSFTLVTYGSHNGVFSSVNLPSAAQWQTTYSSTALTLAVSDISRLAIVSGPTSTNAGAILSPLVVQVQDSSTGNPIPTNGLALTVSLASGNGTLSGTVSRATDSNGRATFNDLSINLVGNKTLVVAAPGLTPAVSSAFSILNAAPAQLVLASGISARQRDGIVFSPPPVVQVADQFGNVISNSTARISAGISAGSGGVLGGNFSLNADGATGSATFTNLIYNLANHQAAETAVIYFASPGLRPVTNNAIIVNFNFGLTTLRDGNSVLQLNPSTQEGLLSWSIDGLDQLYQQWFWLRQGSNAPQVSFDALAPALGTTSALNSASINYYSPGLTINLALTLKGGASGSHASDLAQVISIQNTTNRTLGLHLYQYSDFDLGTNGIEDTVSFPSTNIALQQGEGMRMTETVQPPAPDYFEASYYAITLDKILGTAPLTLSDQLIPAAPGDQTFAYQWEATLDPGQTLVINLTNSIRAFTGPVALSITGSGDHLLLAWPTNGTSSYHLESISNDGPNSTWQRVNESPTVAGEYYEVVVRRNGSGQFYRLSQ